jgi:hypothetical protein
VNNRAELRIKYVAKNIYCEFKLKPTSIKTPLIKGPIAEPITIIPAAKDFMRPK